MYAKNLYHDQYYDGSISDEQKNSSELLSKFIKTHSKVLDYGCGFGSFLKACQSKGFLASGVEFDSDAAEFAAKLSSCEVITVEAFKNLNKAPIFDAIHMGDVLEHLPDPAVTIKTLVEFLKPGGILFIEGPLEVNPSPVFWTLSIYGYFKQVFKSNSFPNFPPTHLFRTSEQPQKAFFHRIDNSLSVRHWEVYETGWPYGDGGKLKRIISRFAIFMGRRRIGAFTFGNRFKAIFVKLEASSCTANTLATEL
jgi:SAM-dependent methyltransferase